MPLRDPRVLIAPDKFKGSLSAPEAAAAMARGVRRAAPSAAIDRVPVADGGDGTVEALVAATGGTVRTARVTGPLGAPVEARFGLLGDGRTAVIEMAAASGLVLVPPDQRDPGRTTTRGTGELLLAAIELGVSTIILGIGGSATNDGGAGMAQALGYRLLDQAGRELGPGGRPLGRLDRIDAAGRDPRLAGIELLIACDVDNPLCGPTGASAVYGPQKGASPALIAELDRNLAHYAAVIERDLGVSVIDLPGAGAAGGLGGGLVAFAGGRLKRGTDLIFEAVRLDEHLARADLCLTGEGALDASSTFGKAAVAVARRARQAGCPTIAIVGAIAAGAEAVHNEGIEAYFSLCPGPISLDEAVARAAELAETTAFQVMRAYLLGRRHKDDP